MTSTMRFDRLENSTGTTGLDVTAIPTRSEVGLVPITPTSVDVVSGAASVGANGRTTFTSINQISLNQVFTDTYKNYRVVVTLDSSTGSAANMAVQFRSSGVNSQTTNYFTSGQSFTGGTAGAYNASSGTVGYVGAAYPSIDSYMCFVMDVFQPKEAKLTKVISQASSLNSGGQHQFIVSAVLNNLNSSFDGYTFLHTDAASRVSGSIQVYGYR